MGGAKNIMRDPYLSGVCKFLTRKFGDEKLARFMTVRIARAVNRLSAECMDNFRVADKADTKQMDRYEKARRAGC